MQPWEKKNNIPEIALYLIMSDKNADNHANQCNPNNEMYWQSRGCEERPNDWESQVAEDDKGEEDE